MRCRLAALLTCAGLGVPGAAAQDMPAGHRLMRFADVHHDRVVFTYEGDLWTVPAKGGTARRLTTHPGTEEFAKFSPEGTWIAFTGQYDGGTDVYLMPAGGGPPKRLTWHPADDEVLGFTPDGSAVLFRSSRGHPSRATELYTVPVTGGTPRRLPVDRGGLADFSPDGRHLVYNRIGREFRTWKRYRGGMAQDLWLADLSDGSFRRLTDFPGTDNWPMWVGGTIYFTSDRNGTLNLYALDPTSGEARPLTTYTDFDVEYPSAGPGSIVFQRGGALWLLDLVAGTVEPIPVEMPSERLPVRPEWVDPSDLIDGYGLSPDGARLVVAARGDVYVLPAEKGRAINLTRTQGAREKDPAWSPDGKRVAFYSDRSTSEGRREEELYVVDAAGGEARRLTADARGLRLPPRWSPDSRFLAFGDKHLRLSVVEVETGVVRVVDRSEADSTWEDWGIQEYVFSPDGRWLAYAKLMPNMSKSLFVYELSSGRVTRLTDDRFDDFSPSWDPAGRFLYFLSRRTFEPVLDSLDMNHGFSRMVRPYLLILREGEPSPFAPRDDGAAPAKSHDAEAPASAGSAGTEPAPPVTIDLGPPNALARRTVAAPVEAGEYLRLEAVPGGFVWLEHTRVPFVHFENPHDPDRPAEYTLHRFGIDDSETAVVMEKIGGYAVSADRKTIVYRAGKRFGVVDPTGEHAVGDHEVDLSRLTMRLDRLAEFEQMFHEAWRIERDFFYDPAMHGVDWEAVREAYAPLVAYCGNRDDLNYLLGEMIAELNAGHTYRSGGDIERPKDVRVGLLGVDLAADPGAAHPRIARIVPGARWDGDARSPLLEPGSSVREGDFLIAVDGQPVRATDNPLHLLENTAGRRVAITVSATDDGADPRTTVVEPLESETGLRYRDWVESRRAVVDEAFGGEIAYVHLPSMMSSGLQEFARVFYASRDRRGMIVDARYNTGGFVGDQIIERLARKVWAFTIPRDGRVVTNPEAAIVGPLVLLINEETGSNGEYFAQAWKARGLGPVIGMRTWGGAVGIEPHQALVDGGRITAPQFAPYGAAREWLIEGHGVDPDIEVPNLPGDVLAGRDPQLERGIEEMRTLLAAYPGVPAPPAYPDKSKP